MIEKQILHTVLINKNALIDAIDYDSKIFSDAKNQKLFEYIQDINKSGKDIDYNVVMSHVDKLNKLDFFGNDYFTDLMTQNMCLNISNSLNNLNEKHIRNQIKLNSADLYKSLQNGSINYETFIDQIMSLRDSLTESEKKSVNVKDISKMNLDDIFQSSNYLKFGIPVLDEQLRGLFNSNLITIAGQPGAGKTTFALQIACQHKSLFISMEMSKEELYAKILSRLCEISTIKIETKELRSYEMKKIIDTHDRIKDLMDLEIITKVSNFSNMYNTIKYFVEKYNYQCVFIDYLQLIKMDGSDTNTSLEYITSALKNLAKELDIPIVVLSQLTKDAYRNGAIPTLADLRGSGSIGQNSDCVFILWNNEDGKFNFTVAKGRKYKSGSINGLYFNGEFSRIEERFVY